MTNNVSLPAITKQDFSLIDGQPRILDLRLAQALGFDKTYNIRKLIQRHINPLVEAGGGFLHMEQTPPGAIGGRPGLEYRLTLDQALYLCAKAGTERAARITLDMVRVYRATYLEERVSPCNAAEQLLAPCAKAALRYARLGLNGGEVGRLLGMKGSTTRALLQKLRVAGMLPSLKEAAHG